MTDRRARSPNTTITETPDDGCHNCEHKGSCRVCCTGWEPDVIRRLEKHVDAYPDTNMDAYWISDLRSLVEEIKERYRRD